MREVRPPPELAEGQEFGPGEEQAGRILGALHGGRQGFEVGRGQPLQGGLHRTLGFMDGELAQAPDQRAPLSTEMKHETAT